MSAILETRGIAKRFGGLMAVARVDFTLDEGELRSLIGPNGAGKTTFFNLLTGHLHADEGTIIFRGRDVTGLPVYARARLGIVRKYQSPTVFDELTVFDNIRVAARGSVSPFALFFRRFDPEPDEQAELLLETVRLAKKRNWLASKLSHGERQWLEIGMVLANRPRLLLLDEPTAGMTPAETRQTAHLLKEVASDTSTIVIEHDIKFVREIASRVTVLHKGAILAEGRIEEIALNDTVRNVYLGREDT
jgi:urea transport system ATP-binding protein